MAKMAQAFILTCLFSLMAFAGEPHATEMFSCRTESHSQEVSIVIQETKSGSLEMRVYRCYYGHSVPPEVFPAEELPGTRGPIVAYGDQAKNRILVLNFSNRTENGQIVGTFTDTLSSNSLTVFCR